jgi:hypothetical protein
MTSSNPGLLLLSLTPNGAGSASITMPIAAGQTTPAIGAFLIGLAASGKVTLTASATGYPSAMQTVILVPSGFTVTGGQAIETSASPSTVTVSLTALDPATMIPIAPDNDGNAWWQLRPGAAAATVTLHNDNTAAGKLAATSLTVQPGGAPATTTFTPLGAGTSNISIVSTPVGYITPAAAATTTQFKVSLPPLSLQYCPSQVGYNTVSPVSTPAHGLWCYPQLPQAAPAGGVTVKMTSSNPNLLLVSLSPTSVGSASVTVNVPVGTNTPSVSAYLIGLASSGKVTLTASAPGFANATQTVQLVPSGFVLTGGQQTTSLSPPSPVTVSFTALDPVALSPIAPDNDGNAWWQLRDGATAVTVNLKNDNTKVGTLSANSVGFASGLPPQTVNFTPASAGTSNISIPSAPAGYTTPAASAATTQFSVSAPPISLQWCPTQVGMNTVSPISTPAHGIWCYPQLSVAAPSTGRVVTLTSSNPAAMRLSLSPTGAGTASVSVEIGGGQTIPNVTTYLIGLANSGTVTLTASAPGYASGTLPVALVPSGFVITGGQSTTTYSQPSTMTVSFSALNPGTLEPVAPANDGNAWFQMRAGLAPVILQLKDDKPTVGTLGASSMTFAPGLAPQTVTFTPVSTGTANISVVPPAGYATPAADAASTQFIVTAPSLSMQWCPGQV